MLSRITLVNKRKNPISISYNLEEGKKYKKYIDANNPLICRFGISGFTNKLNIIALMKMRKLILEVQMSIDGFIAGANGNTDWMLWNWGPDWTWDYDLQQYHTDLTKSIDCILLSRQMAEEGFIAHWANAAENPEDPRFEFAKHITNTHKIVFTKTLNKSTPIPGGWDKTDIVDEDFVEAINKLKKKNGKDIIVYGGATLVSSLIRAELIDEFHLLVNPVAIGAGLPTFNNLTSKQNMTLIRAKAFDSGMVILHYKL